MIKIIDKSKCSGCYACADICPKNCISMVLDSEGFKYPSVNNEQCVSCGLCEKTCPIIDKPENNETTPLVFAAINKNVETRISSSSGGIFTLLAEEIINNGGVVFGAAFADDFKSVEHIAVTEIKSLFKLRGSKYLQSQIGKAYKEAESYLKEGLPVYFSGTPCQIAGLYSYLGKEYENLYTQDLICHGVPSPYVWKKYVEYREKIAKSITQGVFFRHKRSGWKKFSLQFVFKNSVEHIQTLSDDLYMKGFLSNLFLRPSCHNCSFKTVNRIADITLADFWGVEKTDLDMDDDKGTSLILIHSKKGKLLLEKINQYICVKETDLNFVKENNSAISKSSVSHKNRDAFFKKMKNKSIDYAISSCLKIPIHIKIIIFFKRTIKKILKIFRINKL